MLELSWVHGRSIARQRAGASLSTAGMLFLAPALPCSPQRFDCRSPAGEDDVFDAVRRRVVRPGSGAPLGANQHPQFLIVSGAISFGAAGASTADDGAGSIIRPGGASPASASDQSRPRRAAWAAPHRQCRGKRTCPEKIGDRLQSLREDSEHTQFRNRALQWSQLRFDFTPDHFSKCTINGHSLD
jgi:hypothetical protein